MAGPVKMNDRPYTPRVQALQVSTKQLEIKQDSHMERFEHLQEGLLIGQGQAMSVNVLHREASVLAHAVHVSIKSLWTHC